MANLNDAFSGFLIDNNYTDKQNMYYVPEVGTTCTVSYSPKCRFCHNTFTLPITNDGGRMRRCGLCNQIFKAKKIKKSPIKLR
jgi:hypothetical protein